MKKILVSITILLFTSCLPVFDTIPMMLIVNRTEDTILVGHSYYNNIDSIDRFIESLELDTTEVLFRLKGNIVIKTSNKIAPDSFGITDARVYSGQDHKIYFFILRYKVAKNHSWSEIRKSHLYDTLLVTQEMLENGNRIEYNGLRDHF